MIRNKKQMDEATRTVETIIEDHRIHADATDAFRLSAGTNIEAPEFCGFYVSWTDEHVTRQFQLYTDYVGIPSVPVVSTRTVEYETVLGYQPNDYTLGFQAQSRMIVLSYQIGVYSTIPPLTVALESAARHIFGNFGGFYGEDTELHIKLLVEHLYGKFSNRV